jgi:hypothetical protein
MTKLTSNNDKSLQIEALRKTILSAEKTIQSAKAMLLQLEGKKKVGRHKKISDDDEGQVVFGTFDGQIMIGDDGKQYPVPANYASKSKLVEGDMLKLIIDNGSFIYKQVGPIERRNLIGVAGQDEGGNYFVISEGTPYKILLASITYFKIEPGDEVVIPVPAEKNSLWAAIENVLQKNNEISDYSIASAPIATKDSYLSKKDTTVNDQKDDKHSMIDEWMSDIEEIKKEIQEEKTNIKA